jgi:hypothetical protein
MNSISKLEGTQSKSFEKEENISIDIDSDVFAVPASETFDYGEDFDVLLETKDEG